MHATGDAADKTNFAQSLMHMIKGNLGTGILAMPASFAHTGLVNAIIGLPILCLISTYCVHLLIKSSQKLEQSSSDSNPDYADLAKYSFKYGPDWISKYSRGMCRLVDITLLLTQIGVCSVYLVFVVENLTKTLASHQISMSKSLAFVCIYPIALLLSYIRTLRRLAVASGFANFLQVIGISLVIEYLVRDIDKINLAERDKFRPLNEVALGFGSAMFAFEGISVVLPIYSRMKHAKQMSSGFGVVNISYGVLLFLYFIMGFFGYLKFGHEAKDSITLNLPPTPLYDGVRAIFAVSVFLTYPLQFYVPNDIIWQWFKKNRLEKARPEEAPEMGNGIFRATQVIEIAALKVSEKNNTNENGIKVTINDCCQGKELDKCSAGNCKEPQVDKTGANQVSQQETKINYDCYDYGCRTALVTLTFLIAIVVPKLNLLMDLIGSISGTALSLILPAIIHLAAYWNRSQGLVKFFIIVTDLAIIFFGVVAGASGSISSIASIVGMIGL